VAGLDYRHTGLDYREGNATYGGVLTATVSAGTVAAVAAVPAVTVTAHANVAPGVVAAVAAVPSVSASSTVSVAPAVLAGVAAIPAAAAAAVVDAQPGVVSALAAAPAPAVTADASAAPAVVAVVAAVPAGTVTATASVSAAVVASVTALPAAVVSQTANPAPDTVARSASVSGLSLVRHVQTGTTDTLGTMPVGEEFFNPFTPENRLARFYNARAKGRNLWIVNDATVATDQPTDETTITRTIHGGHTGPDLTETEADLLSVAGYTIDVEESVAA